MRWTSNGIPKSANISICSAKITTVTDAAKKRTEATQRAAECRERAAKYEALSAEAQRRGDIEMSIEFASKAAEEQIEAHRIEESISKIAE